MSDNACPEQVLAGVPTEVARSLVDDDAPRYPARARDPATAVTAAITVLGVASDVVSLALAREAIADLLRRLRSWGRTQPDRSELTLRIGERVDVRLRVRGDQSDEQVLSMADRIVETLRTRTENPKGPVHGRARIARGQPEATVPPSHAYTGFWTS